MRKGYVDWKNGITITIITEGAEENIYNLYIVELAVISKTW